MPCLVRMRQNAPKMRSNRKHDISIKQAFQTLHRASCAFTDRGCIVGLCCVPVCVCVSVLPCAVCPVLCANADRTEDVVPCPVLCWHRLPCVLSALPRLCLSCVCLSSALCAVS